MPRLFVTALVALLLLGGPVLCLAGFLEHLCTECPESFSCGHEDDCEQDPCSEIAMRPASSMRDDLAPPAAVLPGPLCGSDLARLSSVAGPPRDARLAPPSLLATNRPLRI